MAAGTLRSSFSKIIGTSAGFIILNFCKTGHGIRFCEESDSVNHAQKKPVESCALAQTHEKAKEVGQRARREQEVGLNGCDRVCDDATRHREPKNGECGSQVRAP